MTPIIGPGRSGTSAPVTPDSDPTAGLRLRRVERNEVIRIPARLENLLAEGHLARLVWGVVRQLDLTAFYKEIAVTVDRPGRPAIDPLILIALWVYALSQGEMEARKVGRLCVEHLAYIWLCGGVAMNYHTLSDFRVKHEVELEGLLTQVVQCLDEAGCVGWEVQAQDGMRVRASAGAASFHREPTLKKALVEAQAEVAELENPTKPNEETVTLREQAAREQAANERVDVVNEGSDKGQMDPMLQKIRERYRRLPKKWAVDGGFVKLTALETWGASVEILAPLPKPKDETRDPHQPLPKDTPEVAAWRERMGTDAAKKTYKLRAATAECVNAQARTREGVQQSGVRGKAKNRCLALWVAITHNLLIWIRDLVTIPRAQPEAKMVSVA